MRWMFVAPAYYWLQTSASPAMTPPDRAWELGIGVVMVFVLAGLWREERKSRDAAAAASELRYAVLVEAFMKANESSKELIATNTAALTKLQDTLKGGVADCPLMANGADLHRKLLTLLQKD